MEQNVKSQSINSGLYLGAILSILVVLVYAIKLDLFTEWWLGIITLLIVVVYSTMNALKVRKLLGGFINFKKAFGAYFITMAIGTFIVTVVSILIFSFIDPEAAQYLNEQILLLTKQTMERFGAPAEAIEKALENAADVDNFSVGMQTQSYFFRLALYTVFGLIIALVVKKSYTTEA